MRPPRDVVVPLLAGAAVALLARAVRRVSEGRRSVDGVGTLTGAQDAPALLFDLEEAPVAPARRPRGAVALVERVAGFVGDLEVELDLEAVIVEDEPAPLEPEPERELPDWARALGVFDLETTGVDTASARIVTACVALIDEDGAVVERHDWIADPGVPIPPGATAVHGVSDERARRFGRPSGEVVAEILTAVRGLFDRGFPLVVYNAPYDLTLLDAEAHRHGLEPIEGPAPVVDPLVLDKRVDRYRRGKRTLTATAAEYGVPFVDAHEAGADAIAAGRVAQAIARRHADVLTRTAAELHDAEVRWCADQAERFQAYMRERRDPDFTASGSWPRR